ncbi:MAG: hypothetical protein QOE70_975 [Chthoniobacter sp.]|jgi:EpsI family protein|nr:hypothetical protein [Chthoniobacter sp.]
MTTKRLAVLLVVLLAGLGSVVALPKAPAIQPVGIQLELPQFIGGWYGRDLEISEKERLVLGAETEFARRAYRNGRGDEIQVTIVLSGHDMNTSIHRPERCLPAQGWTIADKRSVALLIPDRGVLSATRLHNLRPIHNDAGTASLSLFNLNYYWFVGYTDVTGSHWGRTWIDMTDRLFKGYNQRWAYVTVSATITDNIATGGLNEAQTDALLRDFIKRLVPIVHKESAHFD